MPYASRQARKAFMAVYYQRNKQKFYIAAKETKRKLRLDVIHGYGGKCVCCGEDNEIFLALDHVHNNGAVERRNGLKSDKLYAKVRRANYPPDYQLLCHNCNFAKSLRGGCPHGHSK